MITGSLLAIAIAMALSSVPITATIVILLSPQRQSSSLPFLAGWVLTLGVVPLAAAAGILAMPLSRRERSQFAAAAEILVGAALVIGAIYTWRRSQTPAPTSGGRLERLGSYGPGASFGIAILMGLRPKALLLGIAAGLALGAESPTSDRSALTLALYVCRIRVDGGPTDCVHPRFATLHGAATGDLACVVVPKRAQDHRVGHDDDRHRPGGPGLVPALMDTQGHDENRVQHPNPTRTPKRRWTPPARHLIAKMTRPQPLMSGLITERGRS